MARDKHRFTFNTTRVTRVVETPDLVMEADKDTVMLPTVAERFHRFFEHSYFYTTASTIGGIVGTFLDGRFFALMGLGFAWSLRRSGALDGLKKRPAVFVTIATVVIASGFLYWMGSWINKQKQHVYTPAEYSAAIRAGTPLPIKQQVTNIYNTLTQPSTHVPTPTVLPQDEPRINFTEFEIGGHDERGLTLTNTTTNNGGMTARDVRSTAYSKMLPQSITSENEVFAYIESHAFDKEAIPTELPEGKQYARTEPMLVPYMTTEEANEYRDYKKVLYLGRASSFSDGRGSWFLSEICMYMEPGSTALHYCLTHNGTKKVAR